MAKLRAMANVTYETGWGAHILQEKALHMVYAQPDEEVEKLMIGKAAAGGNLAEGIWSHPGDYTLGGRARAGDEEKKD